MKMLNWNINVIIAALVPCALGTIVLAAAPETPTADSFLRKAAEGQRMEIALGQLATQKASSEQVKQFGAHMIEDHRKGSLEVERLAAKQGVRIAAELSDKHRNTSAQFSKLSGKEFDRAYISYMLRDHVEDVQDFEKGALTMTDPEIKQWAAGSLPVLKEHLQKVKTIASSLGIGAKQTQ